MSHPDDIPETPESTSPSWQPGTRLIAAVLLMALAAATLIRLNPLLVPLILTWLLAFVLHPLVTRLTRWTKLPRWGAVLIVYLIILLFMGGAATGAGLAVAQQLSGLGDDLERLSLQAPAQLEALLESTVTIGPWTIDLARIPLEPVVNALADALRPLLSQTGALLASLVGVTASAVSLALAVMFLGFYLLLDFGSLEQTFLALVPKPHQGDFRRLWEETERVWASFLRGQLILGLVVGALTGAVLSVLGVRFALGLGLIAGLLEFVPIFGPLIAGLLAVLVALFQGSNWWGLSPLGLALLVLAASLLIQQIENNLLVPRIVGQGLKLHPMVVLLAALAGGILAGPLGLLLAAPVVAALRLWLGYVYRKVVGLQAWPDPIPASARQVQRPPSRIKVLIDRAFRRIRR